MLGYGKNVRFASNLVNLTDERFAMYEDSSGEIKNFKPRKADLPEEPESDVGGKIVHYVVSLKDAIKIRRAGRELNDIAILKRVYEHGGRGGANLGLLIWAKSPKNIVRWSRSSNTVGPHYI